MSKKPDIVSIIVRQMEREGLPQATLEHRFHPVRKWRFDMAFLEPKLAFEYEGGVFSGGAHTRGKHFISDIEKYNTAALMGWKVFRLHADMVYKGKREMTEAVDLIKEVLTQWG